VGVAVVNVSAIIVTRGNIDVDLMVHEIESTIPDDWEILIWDNGRGILEKHMRPGRLVADWRSDLPDLAVYGRYAAIEHADGDLIYVQDDDCVVEEPEKLVSAWRDSRSKCSEEPFDARLLWHASSEEIARTGRGDHVVCNMPQPFRHDFYRDHALVGFGAVFHRDAPQRAFDRYARAVANRAAIAPSVPVGLDLSKPAVLRTCDVVFTALTPRILVDVPYRNLPWATDPDRMYHQPQHTDERRRMLELALKVRDA